MTPLALACMHGYDDIAQALIPKVDLNDLHSPLNTEHSPIYLACQHKEEKFDTVLSMFSRINSNANTSNNEILVSCYYDDVKISQEMGESILRDIFKVSTNESLVAILMSNSHLRILEYLNENYKSYLKAYEDPQGNSLVHLAARHGSPELLKFLVKHELASFKPNKILENPLHIAATNNKFNFIKEFLMGRNILDK